MISWPYMIVTCSLILLLFGIGAALFAVRALAERTLAHEV